MHFEIVLVKRLYHDRAKFWKKRPLPRRYEHLRDDRTKVFVWKSTYSDMKRI